MIKISGYSPQAQENRDRQDTAARLPVKNWEIFEKI
jgi:hypothetical protein